MEFNTALLIPDCEHLIRYPIEQRAVCNHPDHALVTLVGEVVNNVETCTLVRAGYCDEHCQRIRAIPTSPDVLPTAEEKRIG